jgi:hypothetical protein
MELKGPFYESLTLYVNMLSKYILRAHKVQ